MPVEKHTRGQHGFQVSRRTLLKTTLAGATVLAAPGLLIGRAHAAGQYMDLESFQGAGIDWRMADGERITIAVIPAGYFKNLEKVMPLSGRSPEVVGPSLPGLETQDTPGLVDAVFPLSEIAQHVEVLEVVGH